MGKRDAQKKLSQYKLVAWSHNAGEPAVVGTIVVVPEWKPCFDSSSQDPQFLVRTSRSLGRLKSMSFHGGKIFIVPKLLNRVKNVPHLFTFSQNQV